MAKNRKRKKKSGLFGIDMAASPKTIGRKEIGLAMLSVVGGSFLGAVIGRPAGWMGLAVAGGGTAMSNFYLANAGIGMALGAKAKPDGASGTSGISDEEMDGLSMDAVKERAKNYFKEMGEKLYLPMPENDAPAETSTSGLNGEDEVTYFLNPYSKESDQLDMSELDKLQEKVAQMNDSPMGDFGDHNY